MADRKVKLITPQRGYTGLTSEKLGRNSPCRCASGKKSKHCCGNTTAYFSRDKLAVKIQKPNMQNSSLENSQPALQQTDVARLFAFGEWVLIDGAKSGQIVDFFGNGWYMVDSDGVWERYKVDRLTKDERYRSANGV